MERFKLRSFQYSLRTLMLVVLVCAIIFSWPHIWRQIQLARFKSHVGEDLRELSDSQKESFAGIVATVKREPRESPNLTLRQPWHVWHYRSGDENRYLLLEVSPLFMIPGSSYARTTIFDSFGNGITEETFDVGYRLNLQDAHFEPGSQHGFPYFVVTTDRATHEGWMAKEYYAIHGDDIVLVRIESNGGEFYRNNYHNPSRTIGPALPVRTEAEWVTALESEDSVDILCALVWLSGRHSDPPIRNRGNSDIEEYEDALLVATVRSRESTRATLERLSESPDHWIASAARSALDQIEPSE